MRLAVLATAFLCAARLQAQVPEAAESPDIVDTVGGGGHG